MIKLSIKLDISLSKLVIACIGSAACYGIGCYISNLNDSPALENDESGTEVRDEKLPATEDKKKEKEN